VNDGVLSPKLRRLRQGQRAAGEAAIARERRDMPRTRARQRVGRCYELTFRALCDLPPNTAWRLIHGTIQWRGPSEYV